MEIINGFPKYEIHLTGTLDGQPGILSLTNQIYLKTSLNKDNGYQFVSLYHKGKRKHHYVHRLVALYFIHNLNNHQFVDHIDGNRTNNRVTNLRWVTNSENTHNQQAVKGYHWCKKSQKWKACIMIKGKRIHLGSFDKEEDARKAYLEASKKYYPGIKCSQSEDEILTD